MMTVPSKDQSAATPAEDDPLREVFRQLVGIHASMAESLRSDPDILPWSMRRIREVLDYIQSVERARS